MWNHPPCSYYNNDLGCLLNHLIEFLALYHCLCDSTWTRFKSDSIQLRLSYWIFLLLTFFYSSSCFRVIAVLSWAMNTSDGRKELQTSTTFLHFLTFNWFRHFQSVRHDKENKIYLFFKKKLYAWWCVSCHHAN